MHFTGRDAVISIAYLLAVAWLTRAVAATRLLPKLPNLLRPDWDRAPVSCSSLCVIVPARNEAANIAATLESLLAQDCANFEIIAVNDRSDDRTGEIIDRYSAASAGKLKAVHITELPAGWLGKTHAMHAAVQHSSSDYILFTDADIVFAPQILRRAIVYANACEAEHLVVAPTPDIHSAGEGAMLGVFQVLGLWGSRPWKVADPKAKRDFLGVGAFNLVRRDVFLRTGGWEAQPMAVVEDVTLGRRLKAAGAAQRFVSARGAVRVHWAAGMAGTVRVMTKNLFAVMFFQPLLVVVSALFIILFFLAPLAELFWWPTIIPAALCLISIALCYRSMGEITGVPVRYIWLYPLGILAFLYAMFLSAYTVLRHGGVEWRGTHYPLAELRRHNGFRLKT